ncbi:MAG: prepilin-type N-terminal cleavage/methylation domain-containing protein [Desulfobacteraceae bacterium]|nr:prepilin-type N-terminal cleavage/methylation domain-containing protein [Desulfobacteraceae bacterium]
MQYCPNNKTVAKGFTLLEVLVALSVIAIAMVSILRLQSQTIGLCEAVKFYSTAPFLAQTKIADVLMDSRSYTAGASGDFGREHAGYIWQVEVSESDLESGDNPGIPVAEVKVKISIEENDAMQYTVSRFYCVEQGG